MPQSLLPHGLAPTFVILVAYKIALEKRVAASGKE